MSKENLNNGLHWKSKLDALKSLPAEAFDKEASWEKLHSRLHKKTGEKKVWWYWAAAACILAIIFSALFLSNKKENILVKNDLIQTKPKSSILLLPVNNNADIPVAISPIAVEKISTVRPYKNHDKIIISSDHRSLTHENIAIKKDKEEFTEALLLNNTIAPVDSQISIVTIIPVKKKLPVVHINELGETPQEPPVTARRTEFHSLQLKLGGQEVYESHSANPGSAGFTILTIKNSPN